jgi:hypothetical protein
MIAHHQPPEPHADCQRPPKKRTIEFRAKTAGKSMELVHTLDDVPETESEVERAADTALRVLRGRRQPMTAQFVLVESNFVIAVEDMTSGGFVWCGPKK